MNYRRKLILSASAGAAVLVAIPLLHLQWILLAILTLVAIMLTRFGSAKRQRR